MTTNRVWVLMTQIKEQSMSLKTTLGRIVGRSRPPSVSRTAPRRFGYVSVVIATVGAVLAIVLPAAPASANGVYRVQNHSGQDWPHFWSPFCLDADASQAHAYGDIIAWDCSNSNDDDYQDWEITYQENGWLSGLYQLRNVGTLNVGTPTCLDFAANLFQGVGVNRVTNKVIQFTCDSSDPYQLFYITYVGNGNWSFQNLGASEEWGAPLCLDLNYWGQYEGAPMIAYPCDTNDGFQLWYLF